MLKLEGDIDEKGLFILIVSLLIGLGIISRMKQPLLGPWNIQSKPIFQKTKSIRS